MMLVVHESQLDDEETIDALKPILRTSGIAESRRLFGRETDYLKTAVRLESKLMTVYDPKRSLSAD
jgi:hypothetical protein